MKKIFLLLLLISVSFAITAATATQVVNTDFPVDIAATATPIYYAAGNAVYVWGGVTDDTLTYNEDMYKLDLTTGTWSVVTVGGAANAPDATLSSTAVYDSDNDVIIYFGGQGKTGDESSQNVSIFNPVAEAWLAAGDTPQADAVCINADDCERTFSQSVYVAGDGMYVFGGVNDTASDVDDAFWKYVYAAGAGAWTKVTNAGCPTERAIAGMVHVGGVIYFYGGIDATGNVVGAASDYHTYTIATNTWSADLASGIRVPLAGFATAYDSDDNLIYIIGGGDNATIVNQTYAATPGGAFAVVSSADSYRAVYQQGVYVSDFILAIGGLGNGAVYYSNYTVVANPPTVTVSSPAASTSGTTYRGTMSITGSNTNPSTLNTGSATYFVSSGSSYNAGTRLANGAFGTAGILFAILDLPAAYWPNGYYTLRTIVADVLGVSTTTDTTFQIVNPAPTIPIMSTPTGKATQKIAETPTAPSEQPKVEEGETQ